MNLLEEWKNILNQCTSLYIYGAGKIGRTIFTLIKEERQLSKFKGFVVTNTKGNPDCIEGSQVSELKDIKEKEATILVAVSDIYQNEIMQLLSEKGFENVVCVYKFYPLAEQKISGEQHPSVIDIDIRELLARQYNEKVFCRYDILVRLLAIENYYDKNDFGFELYRKMQNCRIYLGYDSISEKRFRELIDSVEVSGFDSNSEIFVDSNLRLIDGSHRVALALYHNMDKVKIRILNKQEENFYGLNWFAQYFGKETLDILKCYESKIQKMCFADIKGIIWSRAFEYVSEITETINEICKVEEYKDYIFSKEAFEQFVRDVYWVDSIAEWKIETKLDYLEVKEENWVRILDINMGNPEFRVKQLGTTISQKGEKLKKIVRETYKGRITNYFPDIIFHTADNYYQSEYIDEIEKRNSMFRRR